MAKELFSKTFVGSVSCPADQAKVVFFDKGCRSLVLEVRPTGTKVFSLRYVDKRGKQRQHKIGNAQDISLDQARKQADKLRAKITMGEDIDESQKALKQVPTVSDFIHAVYLPFIEGYKKSWKSDKGLLKNHIEPIWGKKYLDQITRSDLITLMAEHRKTHAPGSCNRLLILLRYMFNVALRSGDLGITKNPTAGYPLMKEDNKHERFLTKEDAQVLFESLKRSNNKMLQYIIPLLLLTGARKREVLDARWEDFDFERNSWRIHTTKLGCARHVPLSDGAITLLQSVPRFANCPWAFPNPQTKLPFTSIFFAWDSARKAAGLGDVRIHDLRHSFASFLVNAGRTLYEVQLLLGHTQIKTTARYSHLSKDTLLDASNAAARAVGHLFTPTLSSPKSAGLLPLAH
jgi:integrase